MYAVIIFAVMILYGVIHSLLASLKLKMIARRKFGSAADRYYRLAYNLFAVISLVPVLVLVAALPDRVLYKIPFPWSLLTIGIQALGVLFLTLGLLETGPFTFLGIRQIFAPREEEDSPLVVTGLYRFVRHPLYSSGLLIIWLTPVMTMNLLAFNIAATFYLILGARVEERKLIQQYGETYLRYKQETPMLLPSFRPRQNRKWGSRMS